VEVEVKGTPAVRDELEIIEAKAFSPQDLPSGNLSHDHDRQLNDYLHGLTTVA
jgi:8-oxo-dGTP diphosphatase